MHFFALTSDFRLSGICQNKWIRHVRSSLYLEFAYSCIRKEIKIHSRVIKLEYRLFYRGKAPTIVVKPSIKQVSGKIVFECKIGADPKPTFTWYKDGAVISPSGKTRSYSQIHPPIQIHCPSQIRRSSQIHRFVKSAVSFKSTKPKSIPYYIYAT